MGKYKRFKKFLKAVGMCYLDNGSHDMCKNCVAKENKELCDCIPVSRIVMKRILDYIKGGK